VGDGCPLAATLIVGRGINGGLTSLSGIEPVKGIHQGGERGVDAAHGVARLAVVALPWIER
jgi:hypothetical protein